MGEQPSPVAAYQPDSRTAADRVGSADSRASQWRRIGHGYNFLACDRDQAFLLPPDVREWLPADHWAGRPRRGEGGGGDLPARRVRAGSGDQDEQQRSGRIAQAQDGGEQPVDQGPVDQPVDVPQPEAEDADAQSGQLQGRPQELEVGSVGRHLGERADGTLGAAR
jgi:hypothetical protein